MGANPRKELILPLFKQKLEKGANPNSKFILKFYHLIPIILLTIKTNCLNPVGAMEEWKYSRAENDLWHKGYMGYYWTHRIYGA